MKKWIGLLVGLLCVSGRIVWACPIAQADTPPPDPTISSAVESAVINSPSTGVDLTKDIINYLEPGADWIVALDGEGDFQGLSGAIYTFKSKGWPLASVRAGYGLNDPVSYGSLAIDLPGIAGRFLPQSVKNLSPGVLTAATTYAAKYVRVGPIGGFDWDTHKMRYGISVGAAVTF